MRITNNKTTIQFTKKLVSRGDAAGNEYWALPSDLDFKHYVNFFGEQYIVETLCARLNKQCQILMDESTDTKGVFIEPVFHAKLLSLINKERLSKEDLEKLRDDAIRTNRFEEAKSYQLQIDKLKRNRS